MDIGWERADLLAFRLCCFTLFRLDVLCSSPVRFLKTEMEIELIGSYSLPCYLLLSPK